jgi:hypothetical protein
MLVDIEWFNTCGSHLLLQMLESFATLLYSLAHAYLVHVCLPANHA